MWKQRVRDCDNKRLDDPWHTIFNIDEYYVKFSISLFRLCSTAFEIHNMMNRTVFLEHMEGICVKFSNKEMPMAVNILIATFFL